MRIKRLAIAGAIISTLGFACYNEPHYPTTGMSNGPAGSGSGPASVTYGGPPAGTAAGAAVAPAASKGAAKK